MLQARRRRQRSWLPSHATSSSGSSSEESFTSANEEVGTPSRPKPTLGQIPVLSDPSLSVSRNNFEEFEQLWKPVVELVNALPRETQPYFGQLMIKVGKSFVQSGNLDKTTPRVAIEDEFARLFPIPTPKAITSKELPQAGNLLPIVNQNSLSPSKRPYAEKKLVSLSKQELKAVGSVPSVAPPLKPRSPLSAGSYWDHKIETYSDLPFIYRDHWPVGIKITPAMIRTVSPSMRNWGREISKDDIYHNKSVLQAFTRRFWHNRAFRRRLYNEAVDDARQQMLFFKQMRTPRFSLRSSSTSVSPAPVTDFMEEC